MTRTRKYLNRERTTMLGCLIAIMLAVAVSSVSAETLLMPKRDFLMTPTSEVVWGITTLPNAATTTYTIDFGDGSPVTLPAVVTDRSYIAVNHQFITTGALTVTLTVTDTTGPTIETATTIVNVFNPGAMTAFNLRALNINRAIQDGLRYLWTSQSNRTTFDTQPLTAWGNGGQVRSMSALVTLAFENQGYHVPNNNNAWCTSPGVPAGCNPSTLYERYVVERGLNWVTDQLRGVSTGLTNTNAYNPCAGGVGAPPCVSLIQDIEHGGYATAIAIMAMAGSQAPTRMIQAGIGSQNGVYGAAPVNYVSGKTLLEVTQRTVNGYAWGQIDVCSGRGGWTYALTEGCNASDGSTMGWAYSALIDAGGFGAVVPGFVSSEISSFLLNNNALNTDGTYDYQTTGDLSDSLQNMARSGTSLLSLFYIGETSGARVAAATGAVNSRWTSSPGSDYFGTCGGPQNEGCAYAMFNVFKGLKSQGIATLSGVTRPAGPGAIPANDWYAEYEDYLVSIQNAPTNTGGGQWTMAWSCCYGDTDGVSAIAELILSPTPFVLSAGCSTVSISPTSLSYPLDHGLRNVALVNPTPNSTITAICQDENPNFEGIPAYAQDGVITGARTAQLRAERVGTRTAPGNGRVYHVYFQDTVLACTGDLTVRVNMNSTGIPPAIDDTPTWNSVTGTNTCIHP